MAIGRVGCARFGCEKRFTPVTSKKFCSPACGKAAEREAKRDAAKAAVSLVLPAGGVSEAVQAELEAVDRAGGPLAAMCMALAGRLDNATAVMGYAALVKELRVTLAAATAGVSVREDAADELRRRRDEKLAALSA